MNYSNSNKYELCLSEVVVLTSLNNERRRTPSIGVNAGIEIIDCECSLNDFKILENHSVGHQTKDDVVRFDCPSCDFDELINHPYAVKL